MPDDRRQSGEGQVLKFIPVIWGPQVHLPSGSVAHTKVGPNAIRFTSDVHCASVLLSKRPDIAVMMNGEKQRVVSTAVGAISLVPANTELFAGWRAPLESVLFALVPERLRQLAMAEYDDEAIDFCPRAL